MNMTEKEIYANCQGHFKTHKATILLNDDNFLIIDWRREDGRIEYYINYIIDKRRGALMVSGDLGDSIAVWYNRVEPAKLKDWIYNDIGYYISKIRCASDLYCYDENEILREIKEKLDDPANEVPGFWMEVEDEIEKCVYNDRFEPSKTLIDILELDDYSWLYSCGRRINMRVYLWAVGFKMACDQLGIEYELSRKTEDKNV